MRTIARITAATLLSTLAMGMISPQPASADCLKYEQHEDPLLVSGQTKVFYPPMVTDVDPQDCLRAEQDNIPKIVEL